eukprot:2819312-Prymnesium_polylepis.1
MGHRVSCVPVVINEFPNFRSGSASRSQCEKDLWLETNNSACPAYPFDSSQRQRHGLSRPPRPCRWETQ